MFLAHEQLVVHVVSQRAKVNHVRALLILYHLVLAPDTRVPTTCPL